MTLYLCRMEGAVVSGDLQKLTEKLLGYCSSVEVRVKLREAVYQGEKRDDGKPPQELRARQFAGDDGDTWTVQYKGVVVRANHPAECRPVTEVKVSDSIETFLEMIQYTYQHEYLKEGYVYHAHTDRTTIEMYITKLKRLQERGNLNSAIDVESFADKYYVELQSYCMEKDIGDVSNELNDFAQRLLPLINIKKAQ